MTLQAVVYPYSTSCSIDVHIIMEKKYMNNSPVVFWLMRGAPHRAVTGWCLANT
jgi:hypothetical protein